MAIPLVNLCDDSTPFWRDITLRASPGRVDAEVVDNVHNFLVSILHNDSVVTEISGEAKRVPWVTCPGAVAQLKVLIGSSVDGGARTAVDQTLQCTHMLDLSRLAIAHVSRGGVRRYGARIAYDPAVGVIRATLDRDGIPCLEWEVRDGVVVAPVEFRGHDTVGRSIWSDMVRSDPELVEAGLILRRAVFVFRSRQTSGPLRRAADVPGMEGVCYSFQPGRAAIAHRPAGFIELP